MLVVHGGQDFRVVETQGLASFNALQRRGHPQQVPLFSRRKSLGPEDRPTPSSGTRRCIGWLDRWLKWMKPYPIFLA